MRLTLSTDAGASPGAAGAAESFAPASLSKEPTALNTRFTSAPAGAPPAPIATAAESAMAALCSRPVSVGGTHVEVMPATSASLAAISSSLRVKWLRQKKLTTTFQGRQKPPWTFYMCELCKLQGAM